MAASEHLSPHQFDQVDHAAVASRELRKRTDQFTGNVWKGAERRRMQQMTLKQTVAAGDAHSAYVARISGQDDPRDRQGPR